MGDEILLRTECIPIQIMDGSLLPRPRYIWEGVLFSINFFVSFFVSLARLRENSSTDLHEIFREGASDHGTT